MTDEQWSAEVGEFVRAARGDLAILLGLMAMRRTENGSPGRELGILDARANTFAKQCDFCATTYRHKETLAQSRVPEVVVRDPATGLYTEDFLTFLSHIYAPIGAANDPTNLNKSHAQNLRFFYRYFAEQVLGSLRGMTR